MRIWASRLALLASSFLSSGFWLRYRRHWRKARANLSSSRSPKSGYRSSRRRRCTWRIETFPMLLPNGKAYSFYLLQEVKSFITQPSPGMTLKEPGLYEITGLAYSGTGRISKVMVSADGSQSWAEAMLQEPVLSKAFTRFRMPWHWDGSPAILQSRAWDEAGNVQPTRTQFVAQRGELKKVPPVIAVPNQHCNAITSWAVDSTGVVKHVYA